MQHTFMLPVVDEMDTDMHVFILYNLIPSNYVELFCFYVTGLCGTFNGDITDDLTLPDGTIYTGPGSAVREQPRNFSKEWR